MEKETVFQVNRAIITALWIVLMPIMGTLSVFFRKSTFLRYVAFVFYPFFLSFYFVIQMFRDSSTVSACWFSIKNINFDFSLTFGLAELFICVVTVIILASVHLSCIRFDKTNELKQKKSQMHLNLFVAVMCLSTASGNLLSFFIGIELLGLISSTLIGSGTNSSEQSTRAFMFSKFASLVFLTAIMIIANEVKSFDFSIVKIAFDDIENHKNLIFPALLLLISCFCKSAQFPFSRWLIDATIADTYISIILHSATVFGIGIIFISKCYFIFEPIPYLKHMMIYTGLFSAITASLSSMIQTDVKKIMACSTIASIGCVFVACGIGEYSVAILYFICHAFFKSIFFLSFVYVMHVVSYEKNILKMGGISRMIPNINDIVWISFASTIGFPFFISFFGKASLLSALFYSERIHIALGIIAINIILIISFMRLIVVSIYGKSRMDEKTLARVKDISGNKLASPWILLTLGVFGSFISWSMYEWDVLHFGLPGVVYSRSFVDYIFENSMELAQIVVSIFLAYLFKRTYKVIANTRLETMCTAIFRKNIISEAMLMFFYKVFVTCMKNVSKTDIKLNTLINNICHYMISMFSEKIDRTYSPSITVGTKYLLIGLIISLTYVIIWSLYV